MIKLFKKMKNYTLKDISAGMLISIFILPQFVASAISHLFNRSFVIATITGFVSSLILIIAPLFIFILLKKTKMNGKLAMISKAIVLCLLVITIITNALIAVTIVKPIEFFIPQVSQVEKPKANSTYLAYSPTCKYCNKAKSHMLRAVNTYNMTHMDNIRLVNLDKDSEMTRYMKKTIQYKGTIVHLDKNKKATLNIYTTGDDKGPTTPTIESIYSVLQSVK